MFNTGFNRIWPEFDRLFGEFDRALSPRVFHNNALGSDLKVNLYEDEKNQLHLTALLPGYKPEDLDISVVGNRLTLKGKREGEKSEKQDFLLSERCDHSFERQLRLPWNVDPENVDANLKDGVLHLRFVRDRKDQPRSIVVSSN